MFTSLFQEMQKLSASVLLVHQFVCMLPSGLEDYSSDNNSLDQMAFGWFNEMQTLSVHQSGAGKVGETGCLSL